MTAILEQERAATPMQAPKVSTEQVQQALHWALTSDKVPANVKVSLCTSLWFLSVDGFYKSEDETLANGKYESSRDEHRYILSALIERGEKLVLAAKQNGIDASAPFTLRDLEAAVESLHIAFHAEHRNANSEKVNHEITQLFDVKESKD